MAFVQFLLVTFIASFCSAAYVRVSFEKCGTKGFTCYNSVEIASKVDVYFECNNVTGQEISIYVWQFNSPGTITSFTIQNCNKLQLFFTCSAENKPIQWLKVKNVGTLEIAQATVVHSPPKVIFENISYIETLPRDTFSQIKKTFYKPGCFIPIKDMEEVHFENVRIGTIETEAFKNLTEMRNVTWTNVTVDKISYGAMKLSFVENGYTIMDKCNLGSIEPLALQVNGDKLSITKSDIGDIWGSGINGTIYDFEFSNNSVNILRSDSISVLAKDVYINNNLFRNVESGSFKKISPGLLHDSQRNFGNLIFVYSFNNNLIEHVEDGGIRPDIEAYKNVAAEVSYAQNTMQCSCESLSWLGTDVDLGYGFSVLRDFNTMILDPANSNKCHFTPCMCFGVRPPNTKGGPSVTIF